MKQTWRCPKCGGQKIGYFDKLKDRNDGERGRTLDEVWESKGLFSASSHGADVEAFVCTTCGYFEEYVKAPETIDWDRLPHFRWCRR